MKINLTYTVNKKSIPDFYHEVLNCYGLSAKNIKNSTLFIVKNIFTSYTYDKDLKTYTLKNNLHQNQLEIIYTVNQTIINLNAKLKAKYAVKLNLDHQATEKYEEDTQDTPFLISVIYIHSYLPFGHYYYSSYRNDRLLSR